MRKRMTFTRAGLALTLIVANACRRDSLDPRATMRVVAAPPANIVVQSVVTPVPAVRITGSLGQPLEGVAVSFVIVRGAGEIQNKTAMSNASGIASVGEWIVGTAAGVNSLLATADGFQSVSFVTTATPGPIAKVESSFPTDQFGFPMASVKAPSIHVLDKFRNGIGGVRVTFTAAGGGVLQNVPQTTDLSGFASVGSWSLGPQTGINTVSARIDGVDSAFVFTARAINPVDAQIFRLDSITGVTGQWTPDAFYVTSAKLVFGPDNLFFESIEWDFGHGVLSASYDVGKVTGTNQDLQFTGMSYRPTSAKIEGPRLLIDRLDLDWPVFLETWVYKRVTLQ